MAKKSALGKGLSALLENSESSGNLAANYSGTRKETSSSKIKISQIEANPYNPRTHFEKEALEELSDSIREHGIIQPITVRKVGNKYQIISGERRFRAAQLVGLDEVPVYVREADDQTVLEMALVENIQREDLDAIEVAISFQRLIDECDLTQDALSKKIGKNRTTVTNYLRLLKLSADVQIAVRERSISMGHARSLAGLDDEKLQKKVLQKILKDGLSVRQTEKLVALANQTTAPGNNTKAKEAVLTLSFEQQKVKTDLEDYLGTKISIKKGNNGTGKIVINFASEGDFKRIIDLLDF